MAYFRDLLPEKIDRQRTHLRCSGAVIGNPGLELKKIVRVAVDHQHLIEIEMPLSRQAVDDPAADPSATPIGWETSILPSHAHLL
jgi:hypothetical protein